MQTLEQAKAFARNWIVTAMQAVADARYSQDRHTELGEELAVLSRTFGRMVRASEALSAKVTDLQENGTKLMLRIQAQASELERLRQAWPHWECPSCRAFNGEVKAPLPTCRACGHPNPEDRR